MAHRTTPFRQAKPALFIVAFLLAFSVAAVTPAQASCDKAPVTLLKFILPNAVSNFSAIRAQQQTGNQYPLTSEAEAFCPNVFILSDFPADGNGRENWVVKWASNVPGSEDDALISILHQFSAVMAPMGFPDKPTGNATELGFKMEWDGPSGVWVTVEAVAPDDNAPPAKTTLMEIRVGHTVQ